MGGAWTCLVLAGIFEIGWPVGLKMAQTPGRASWGVAMAVVCMALSGALLWLAQRHIPMGTAYAVWTGIGAAGTFLIGVAFHGDPAGLARLAGVACIVGGVALLKSAS